MDDTAFFPLYIGSLFYFPKTPAITFFPDFLQLISSGPIEPSVLTIADDVHFRPGVGADGHETFTPRTVIYDLKGGFGTLRKFNALYEDRDDSAPVQGVWDGTTLRTSEPAIAPTEYQRRLDLGLPTTQLRDSDVRYWSDFNRVFYHPKSIVQLNEYELNSQLMPFQDWHAGEELFQSLDREFDLLDRDIRTFVEECDHMQGFQLFSGVDDAWGGFVAQYLDNLRDEFDKTSIWVWGLEDCTRAARVSPTQMNAAGPSLMCKGTTSVESLQLGTIIANN